MKESAYAITARTVITRTLSSYNQAAPKALRRALVRAYPFDRRAGWRYRVWLREVKALTGIKNRNTRQPDLFEVGA